MIKSDILWNKEDFIKFVQCNKLKSDDFCDPWEYPCMAIIHQEYDPNYCTSHRRGMTYYYSEFISLKDFLNTEDMRILNYIQDFIMEEYNEKQD